MSHPEPFVIDYQDRGGYLRAYVRGSKDSVATSLAYWKEIADECRRAGTQRVLVVERFDTAVPLTEVFEVAEQLPSIVHGLTVAFVDEELSELGVNTFGEVVAVNRGAVGKVFPNEADAEEWLAHH